MSGPNIVRVGDLVRTITENGRKVPPGMMWLPQRQGQASGIIQRLRAAWLVLTGKADALDWRVP